MTPFLRIFASPPDPPSGAIRGPWFAPTRPGCARSLADPAKQARTRLSNGLAKPPRLKTIQIHPFIGRILMEAAAKVYGAVLCEIWRRTADRNLTSMEELLAVFLAPAAACKPQRQASDSRPGRQRQDQNGRWAVLRWCALRYARASQHCAQRANCGRDRQRWLCRRRSRPLRALSRR